MDMALSLRMNRKQYVNIGAVVYYPNKYLEPEYIQHKVWKGNGWCCSVVDSDDTVPKYMYREAVEHASETELKKMIMEKMGNFGWFDNHQVIYFITENGTMVYIALVVPEDICDKKLNELKTWVRMQMLLDDDDDSALQYYLPNYIIEPMRLRRVIYHYRKRNETKSDININGWEGEIVKRDNNFGQKLVSYKPVGKCEIGQRLREVYKFVYQTFDEVWYTENKGNIRLIKLKQNEVWIMLTEFDERSEEQKFAATCILEMIANETKKAVITNNSDRPKHKSRKQKKHILNDDICYRRIKDARRRAAFSERIPNSMTWTQLEEETSTSLMKVLKK